MFTNNDWALSKSVSGSSNFFNIAVIVSIGIMWLPAIKKLQKNNKLNYKFINKISFRLLFDLSTKHWQFISIISFFTTDIFLF